MTKNDLLKFNKKRKAGGGLPELGVISLKQEDLIRRYQGEDALLDYEPNKAKLLSAGAAGRYAYEKRYGSRPGEYTTADERMRLEMDKGPMMGPDWGYGDYVEGLRKRQYKSFKGEDPTKGIPRGPIGVRSTKRASVSKNPMLYGDKREEPPQTNHPLSGMYPGRYMVNDVEILWDGTQEAT